jgi:DNA polymerase-3 subunit gamma/tau
LANLVEEPLLQGIRTQLTAYLRDKLNNSNINVIGVMQAFETKRVAYTNKEKFDFLAEKNPILLELKERLGLDTDY